MAMDATNLTEQHRPSASDRRDLHRAFLAWTGDPVTADDLAQETLLAAWTSTRQPQTAAEWRPWLFGVARNILLRWRREMAKHGQRTAPPPESERHLIAASAPDDLDELMTRSDIIALLDRWSHHFMATRAELRRKATWLMLRSSFPPPWPTSSLTPGSSGY